MKKSTSVYIEAVKKDYDIILKLKLKDYDTKFYKLVSEAVSEGIDTVNVEIKSFKPLVGDDKYNDDKIAEIERNEGFCGWLIIKK